MKRWGAVVLCVAVATAGLGAAEQLALDGDSNGAYDQWYTTTNGRVVEIRTDRDGDGLVDYLARYGSGDDPEYEEYDFNYDGLMDDFYYYAYGMLAREEIDTNFDGKVDLWVYLHKGIYVERYERDTDFDGKKDRVVDYSKR